MPFTISHPALIIPFIKNKKRFSITGLVAGSIIPDFEYFLRMKKETSYYSHTLGGLFYFDIPAAILLTFVFHLIIRNSLLQNLPSFLQKRFNQFQHFNWLLYFKKNWVIILFSVFLGAGLHLLWDSLIHITNHLIYTQDPSLTTLENVNKERLHYYFIWSINSFIGFFIVSYMIYRRPVHHQIIYTKYLNYWIFIVLITIVLSVIRIKMGYNLSFDDIIVTICTSAMLGIIITSLFTPSKISENN